MAVVIYIVLWIVMLSIIGVCLCCWLTDVLLPGWGSIQKFDNEASEDSALWVDKESRGATGMANAARVKTPGPFVDPDDALALGRLLMDDAKGNSHRVALPSDVYIENIASFLRFEKPLSEQLYVVGGRSEGRGPLDTLEMFDTWRGRWVSCPSMLSKRAAASAAALPDGRLVVVGGYDARGIVTGALASCEIFDPVEHRWSSACAPMARPRWGHACASLGGTVYAVAGCSPTPNLDSCETLQSSEAYDSVADKWFPVASLRVARGGVRVVAVGGSHLAAIGGCNNISGVAEYLCTVELYDALVGQWTLLDTKLSVPRVTAAVAPLDDTRLFICGGASAEVSMALASAEVYDLPTSEAPAYSGNATEASEVYGDDDAILAEDDDCLVDRHTGKPAHVEDLPLGRMGCQAVAIDLPAPGASFPLRTRRCVAVVGGETDDGENRDTGEAPDNRQLSSVHVYDTVEGAWRSEAFFPPMPTPRTAMALCVSLGRV